MKFNELIEGTFASYDAYAVKSKKAFMKDMKKLGVNAKLKYDDAGEPYLETGKGDVYYSPDKGDYYVNSSNGERSKNLKDLM